MDPIRPFATLIRALRTSRKSVGAHSEPAPPATAGSELTALGASAVVQPLEQALRARLPDSSKWDSRRAREIFLEHALSRELGAEIARDAAFAELVANVSELMEQQPTICARLDNLLRSMANATR